MQTISVVIPFYQREPGILGRSLRSIEAQVIPEGWRLQAVLVDDGSPLTARQEIVGHELTGPRSLRVIEQPNGGAGAARNRGLDIATSESDAIAFLDSDDIWPSDHVARAIAALDTGFDFYFTDNRRGDYHESHCRGSHVPRTAALIKRLGKSSGVVELPHEEIIDLCLTEFPCQASTVVYRKRIAPHLRFKTHLKSSGEDVLFFTELLTRSSRVGFDLDSIVECGTGVNIFFGNLGWDSPRFLGIRVDQLLTHRILAKAGFLSVKNQAVNDGRVRLFSAEVSYHLLRNFLLHPARAITQAMRLWRTDPGAGAMVMAGMPGVAMAKLKWRPAPAEAH